MRIARWRLALTGAALVLLLVSATSLVLGQAAARSAVPGGEATRSVPGGDAARAATDSSTSADAAGWLEALTLVATPTDRGADAGLAHLGRFFRHARYLVHAEATLDLPDGGLTTFALDHGTITAVSGGTIALKASDDSTVSIGTNADTKVRKERQKATLSDLAVGAEAYVLSVKEGGFFVARHVWVPKVRASD
jgi:hypothetical protein